MLLDLIRFGSFAGICKPKSAENYSYLFGRGTKVIIEGKIDYSRNWLLTYEWTAAGLTNSTCCLSKWPWLSARICAISC